MVILALLYKKILVHSIMKSLGIENLEKSKRKRDNLSCSSSPPELASNCSSVLKWWRSIETIRGHFCWFCFPFWLEMWYGEAAGDALMDESIVVLWESKVVLCLVKVGKRTKFYGRGLFFTVGCGWRIIWRGVIN